MTTMSMMLFPFKCLYILLLLSSGPNQAQACYLTPHPLTFGHTHGSYVCNYDVTLGQSQPILSYSFINCFQDRAIITYRLVLYKPVSDPVMATATVVVREENRRGFTIESSKSCLKECGRREGLTRKNKDKCDINYSDH